jgi:hypothetical protein
MFLDGVLGNHITDAAGKEFALTSQRQEMVPRLRGGRVSGQPAPTFRETLILGLRYPRRAVHALLRPDGLLFSFRTITGGWGPAREFTS